MNGPRMPSWHWNDYGIIYVPNVKPQEANKSGVRTIPDVRPLCKVSPQASVN